MIDITNTIRSKRREKTKTGTSPAPVTSDGYKHRKTDREWTAEEEKAAFLYTGKMNAAKIFAKYLD